MKLFSLLSNLIGYTKAELYGVESPYVYEIQSAYGVPTPEIKIPAAPIIIAISAVCVGVTVGIVILVKRKMKKNNINNEARCLYGPPSFYKKPRDKEPIEDLYGCPRPDEIDEPEEK